VAIGSAYPGEVKKGKLRGRDLTTGLPREIIVTSNEIREAIAPTVNQIIEGIRDTIEDTPPEIVSDFIERGIVLTGGGALIPGLAKRIVEELKMPVVVADDPLTTVVRGTGKVLEDQALLQKVKSLGGLSP
jgi:rod shape-determining protein MreB